MKLIIDINDNEYIGIKEYSDNVTSYPVTLHLYDAVKNGIPLEQMIAEIESATEYQGTYVNADIAIGMYKALEYVRKY